MDSVKCKRRLGKQICKTFTTREHRICYKWLYRCIVHAFTTLLIANMQQECSIETRLPSVANLLHSAFRDD